MEAMDVPISKLSKFPQESVDTVQYFLWTGRYNEAVAAYREVIRKRPNDVLDHVQLSAAYSLMELEDEAHAEVKEVLQINPKFSLHLYEETVMPKGRSIVAELVNALKKVGLPEGTPAQGAQLGFFSSHDLVAPAT